MDKEEYKSQLLTEIAYRYKIYEEYNSAIKELNKILTLKEEEYDN